MAVPQKRCSKGTYEGDGGGGSLLSGKAMPSLGPGVKGPLRFPHSTGPTGSRRGGWQ